MYFRKSIYVVFTSILCVIFIMVSGCVSTTTTVILDPAEQKILKIETEDFVSQNFSNGWFWLRENKKNWSISKGTLKIITEPGNLYIKENDQNNILIKPISTKNFQLDTKISINPKSNYQQCGLVIFKDFDNYVKLDRLYYNGQKIELGTENSQQYKQKIVPCNNTSLYLRMIKCYDNYYASYSIDGKNYISVGECWNNLGNNLKAGLIASNASREKAECAAEFEYIKITYFNDTDSAK